MANNVLRITFNEPIPVGGTLSFKHDTDTILNTYVLNRAGAGEVTANNTVEKTAANLRTALNLDYPDRFNITYAGNYLTIESRDQALGFSDGTSSHNVTFGYSERTTIQSTGLTGDNYLINNPIILNLESAIDIDYFELSLENLTNQENTGLIRVYADDNNEAYVDLSPFIKGVFMYPQANQDYSNPTAPGNTRVASSNKIKITIQAGGTSTTITKMFIRGGRRTNNTNQTLPITTLSDFTTWMMPSDKIPYWTGYPISGYTLESTGITKKYQSQLPAGILDTRRASGCNQVYIKFLNQKGGYSYWLFESGKEQEQNTNLGSFIRNQKVDDLGNEANSTMQLYSKVPREYMGILKDLCVSSEVYVYYNTATETRTANEFIRAVLDRNSIMIDENKRASAVSIKLDFDYRFNPSVVWSN